MIQLDINDQLFCQKSNYCKDKGVILLMNYKTANYDECEKQIIRFQPQLIELCGQVNSQCCEGNCNQQFEITVPDALCDQIKGTRWFTRWLLPIYVLTGFFLWSLASAEQSF